LAIASAVGDVNADATSASVNPAGSVDAAADVVCTTWTHNAEMVSAAAEAPTTRSRRAHRIMFFP
jgi:hypothetical protein